MKNLRFNTRILIGFSTIIAITIIIIYFSLSQIKRISDNTNMLYNHPLAVSNAVRDINFNTITIFRTTKWVVNAENSEQIEQAVDSIHKCDSIINVSLNMIYDRYLGQIKNVDSVSVSYKKWISICNSVVSLMKDDKKKEALELRETKLSEYDKLIFSQTNFIAKFARGKANEFYFETKKSEENSYKILIYLFAFLILIVILIAFVITSSISKQIKSFIKDIKILFYNNETEQEHDNLSEAQLFNKTVIELKSAHEEIDRFNEELKSTNDELVATNEEYAAINEELGAVNEELASANEEIKTFNEDLEKKVEQRTEDLKQSEYFFRESQNAAKIGSYRTDFITGFWESSEVLDKIFGIDKDYIRSVPGWINIVHKDEQEALNAYLTKEIISEKQSFNREYRIIRINDKQERWVHGLGKVEFDENGNILSMIGTIQDITDRKLIELDIIKAKEKAEESERLKSSFLANLSHEVRTPMNAIVGFTEILTSKEIDSQKHNHFLSLINSSTNQLLNIITDIVNMSKLEVNIEKVFLRKLNLANIMLEALSVMKIDKAKKENVNLIYENQDNTIDCIIFSDEIKLKQILINLLKNALKFTDSGTVKFGYEIKTNSEIEFYVSDTGCGIEADKKDIIFERFRQADDSVAVEYGGNGLGLAISKGYVELLNGKIWIESTVGVGTTFYFTIPYISKKDEAIQKSIDIDLKKINNISILIAEDNPNNVEYLQSILSQFDVKLNIAINGREAINISKSAIIDIVLMDIQMPEINGLETTKAIKQSNPNLPIIGVSAYCSSSEIQDCIDAGCSGFISKPYKEKDILNEIAKYLIK